MAFISYSRIVGRKGLTRRKLETRDGYFEKNTPITVVSFDNREGTYTLQDDFGNRISRCHTWDFKLIVEEIEDGEEKESI